MKYHVFIGSTFDDLKNERKELLRIIMEMGHIPVTADYFDDTAKNYQGLLRKTIEECDCFIALVANKYSDKDGNATPLVSQSSIAAKKGIPVLALIVDEKARSTPAKKEKDAALARKLEDFKNKLRKGPCETWLNIPDMRQKALSLLAQEFTVRALPGWVRADKLIDPSVANELSRLSCENKELRRQIMNDNGEAVIKMREQFKHAMKVLALNKVTLSFYYASGENWENSRQFRYIRIFKLLVPELELSKNTADISRFLGMVLNPDLDKTIRKDYPTPSNTIKKIMADFSLFGLVRCTNEEERETGEEVWEITEYGKEFFAAYRMRQLEKALAKRNG